MSANAQSGLMTRKDDAPQQSETLLDHLVGGGQQRFRDGEAE
jgi:hypothetical protein